MGLNIFLIQDYLDIQGTDALQACCLEIFGVVDARKECSFNEQQET